MLSNAWCLSEVIKNQMEINWQYQMVHKYQMEGDQEPDGSQQEPDGSHLAVPDGTQVPGGGQQTPERHTIGTKKAFLCRAFRLKVHLCRAFRVFQKLVMLRHRAQCVATTEFFCLR